MQRNIEHDAYLRVTRALTKRLRYSWTVETKTHTDVSAGYTYANVCTHMHRTTPAIRAPYMSKYARTRPRCTCTAAAHAPANSAAGTAASHPAAVRSMAAWGCIAPRPRLAVAAAPLSSPSEAPSSPPQLPRRQTST